VPKFSAAVKRHAFLFPVSQNDGARNLSVKPKQNEANKKPSAKFYPIGTDYERCEREKLAWVLFHPNASARQYHEAMQEISARYGL
jgi:hypothetical protein